MVGPNGAGKSSICRILSGEIAPSSGEVSMNGRPLRDWSGREQAKMRAVLPQQSSLQFAFRVLEVVLMGRSPHNDTAFTTEDLDIAQAALRRADAAHLEQRYYTGLFGGERQRVHLARVLAQIWDSSRETTRYLHLDEPTSALGLAHQHSTLSTARGLAVNKALACWWCCTILIWLPFKRIESSCCNRVRCIVPDGRQKCCRRTSSKRCLIYQ